MMIIKDENLAPFQIRATEQQFILEEIKTIEKGERIGETYEDQIGFYSKISSVVKEVAKRKTIRSQDEGSLQDFLREYKEISHYIMRRIDD